jgi:hypothetical protein
LQHRDNEALGDIALHKRTPWWNALPETTEINRKSHEFCEMVRNEFRVKSFAIGAHCQFLPGLVSPKAYQHI